MCLKYKCVILIIKLLLFSYASGNIDIKKYTE